MPENIERVNGTIGNGRNMVPVPLSIARLTACPVLLLVALSIPLQSRACTAALALVLNA